MSPTIHQYVFRYFREQVSESEQQINLVAHELAEKFGVYGFEGGVVVNITVNVVYRKDYDAIKIKKSLEIPFKKGSQRS